MNLSTLLAVAGLAIVATGATMMSSYPSSESATLEVYTSAEQCSAGQGADVLFACQQLETRALARAMGTNWGFKSKGECDALYGAENCVPSDGGAWGVRMAGFTQFSAGTTLHSVLPVYRSTVYPGLYLPNGYPVLEGANTVMASLLDDGGYMAAKPRALSDPLCVERKGVQQCDTLHSFVAGGAIDRPVLAALFSN